MALSTTKDPTLFSSADVSTPATTLLTATHTSVPNPAISSANISVREYIYLLPYPLPPNTPIPYSTGLPDKNPLNLPTHQFEPTSTLVLTSPYRVFVDIRLFKRLHPDDSLLPNKGERNRLEWAFGGTSEAYPIASDPESLTTGTIKGKAKTTNEPEHRDDLTYSKWTHWLDSRHPVGSTTIPTDEGTMYPISPTLTLEHGHMYQPLMHAVKTHEEMWRDVDILPVPTNAIIPLSTAPSSPRARKVCIVLRLDAPAAHVRGLIVRISQFCQGIMMQGDMPTVERWEWGGEGEGEGKGWTRTARVGDGFLPCRVACRQELLAVGGIVDYHDFEWVVEEVWEWN